jgi:hypothetical protein
LENRQRKMRADDTRPFCIHCSRHVGYKITVETDQFSALDKLISYQKIVPVCANCSHELYVQLINDINCEARDTAYRKK